jgi:hypothetical protein
MQMSESPLNHYIHFTIFTYTPLFRKRMYIVYINQPGPAIGGPGGSLHGFVSVNQITRMFS